jgi:quinol monooxygenase YgiN
MTTSLPGVIALNVRFQIPENLNPADFLVALKADQEQTLATEPGALQFVMGQDIHDDHLILLHEQYKTLSDVQYHQQTLHYKTFSEFCKLHNVPDPVVDVYHCQQQEPVPVDATTDGRKGSAAYCLNVESCIKPEFREEFLSLMMRHQASSKAENRCMQFEWGQSTETPNTFYMHEEYQDQEGYQEHEATPHFASFLVFNQKNPYSQPQVVNHYVLTVPE